jgi:glycerophosphoryl diester phosphodiesterase
MKIIGHRGARGLAPENTIAGLKKAIACKVDAIEFDLRVTRDKVVILHHNQSIQGISGKRHFIRNSSFQELKALKPDLATFDEVIKSVPRSSQWFIEVKPWVDIHPIITLIADNFDTKSQQRQLTLRSFSYRTLKKLHRAQPDIPVNILERFFSLRAISRAKRMRTKSLTMKQTFLWSGTIKYLSRRGYKLYAYTLNDPAKVRQWETYGLAGIVTDFPDRFKR